MAVWALGINHTTAPLDLRGRFAYAIDQIEPTLRSLRESLSHQPEAAILSTCNRTELYAADNGDPRVLADRLRDFLLLPAGSAPVGIEIRPKAGRARSQARR